MLLYIVLIVCYSFGHLHTNLNTIVVDIINNVCNHVSLNSLFNILCVALELLDNYLKADLNMLILISYSIIAITF